MKTGILFIVPPALSLGDLQVSGIIQYNSYIPTSIPLGVLSISAYLRKYHEVPIKIVDFNVVLNQDRFSGKSCAEIFQEQLTSVSKEFEPSVVGISALFNSNFSYLKILSTAVKLLFPDAVIITGGGLPTNLYREVLEEAPDIEAVCFGEGELPILGLVAAGDKEAYLDENESWITRRKLMNSGFYPKPDYVADLDEIPPFDFELIDFQEYQKYNRYHGKSEGDSVAISLMTSRGCPFHCCFCASHSIHGRTIRIQSAERVLAEIDRMVEHYHADTFLIEDDHFFIDRNRALKILKGLQGRNLKIEFPNGIAVYAIDESIAQALKDAGVRMATLAVESGSPFVLRDIIHKPLNLQLVTRAVALLRDKDIYIRAFFIIGFPGETAENRRETLEFIRKTGFNWVAVMIATPIAGSELYQICKENHYLVSPNIEDFHYGKGNIRTEDFTPEQIEKERYLMNLDVNFIHNYDMSNGKYDLALVGFQDVVKRVPDHAIAYYCIACCFQKKGNLPAAMDYIQEYNDIIKNDPKWKAYAEYFNLPIPM